ncbi:uncharacterized protein LOC134454931 [Engraulis encrasicolus]|uniref:uncharacterized protein LOC134454931 n=1 Tax=Engraulis encrasicolus TaxID=184585 RepID=UPI002FD75DA3
MPCLENQNGSEEQCQRSQSGRRRPIWNRTCWRPNCQSRVEFQHVPETTLTEEQCREAISVIKHSTDEEMMKRKIKLTFPHRRDLVVDPHQSSEIVSIFPRFKDVKGLIEQDFILMFGEATSMKLLERWTTTFKQKIIRECQKLPAANEMKELLLAADPPEDDPEDYELGWDSDLTSIVLLLHLIPPTAQGRKRPGKVAASQAEKHLVVFKETGTNLQEYMDSITSSTQPYLLAVGTKKNVIHQFFIILDNNAIPCSETSSSTSSNHTSSTSSNHTSSLSSSISSSGLARPTSPPPPSSSSSAVTWVPVDSSDSGLGVAAVTILRLVPLVVLVMIVMTTLLLLKRRRRSAGSSDGGQNRTGRTTDEEENRTGPSPGPGAVFYSAANSSAVCVQTGDGDYANVGRG